MPCRHRSGTLHRPAVRPHSHRHSLPANPLRLLLHESELLPRLRLQLRHQATVLHHLQPWLDQEARRILRTAAAAAPPAAPAAATVATAPKAIASPAAAQTAAPTVPQAPQAPQAAKVRG